MKTLSPSQFAQRAAGVARNTEPGSASGCFICQQKLFVQFFFDGFCAEVPQRFQEPLTHAQRSVIWQQVLAATAAGFRRLDDITYWCLVAFGVSERLQEDAHFKMATATALDRNIPLAEAAQDITEDQWNAIGAAASVAAGAQA